jgi:hypothetical protein
VINTKVAPNIIFYLLAKSHNFLRPLAISFYLIPILRCWKNINQIQKSFSFPKRAGPDPTRIASPLRGSLSLFVRHYQVNPGTFTVPYVSRPFFLYLTHLRVGPGHQPLTAFPQSLPVRLLCSSLPTHQHRFRSCPTMQTPGQALLAAFPHRAARGTGWSLLHYWRVASAY